MSAARVTGCLVLLALLAQASARAEARPAASPRAFAEDSTAAPAPADSLAAEDEADAEPADVAVIAPPKQAPLEALVPEMAAGSYRMSPGVRPYRNRLSFSPGFGSFGTERLFTFRLAYAPNDWLGYEGSIDHNPARSVHAVQHSLSAVLRHPLAGRIQPYAALGYGMFMVFPGRSLNADPVTKNALTAGGGVEFFIRDDLALRGDMRRATVFGRQKDREGVVTYDYLEQSVGLVFYRSIRP